jgi:hypothetical protein
MQETDRVAAARRQALEDILLGYLQSSHGCRWPGADGLTLEDALDCYRQAILIGGAPGPEDLVQRHPELSDAVRGLFDDSFRRRQ